jgi:hypothetical protein
MDEQQAHRFLTELLSNLSAEDEYNVRHEDYVMEMPQSGERFRGREKMREFQETFADHSNPPTAQLRRVVVREYLWVVDARWQDMARPSLLRRAVRCAGVAGSVGRADGFIVVHPPKRTRRILARSYTVTPA